MRPANFRIAVIVTTYNRPDALSAVLEGCFVQTDPDFEVIVADDGSTEETAKVVREFQARAPFTIRHVWQEDIGFRAAAIRNRALAATDADYVVFTDGDCVPPPGFIASHRNLAERGWFLAGNRLMLMPDFTRQVLQEKLPIHLWGLSDWLIARWHGHILRWLPFIRLPDWDWLRKRTPQRWEGVKTCNLSAWRDDLLAVNGLEESYTGWGLEDSDLVIRLLRAGVKHKNARFSVPLFHLWHAENDRRQLEENQQRLDAVLSSDHVRALHGVDQYR
jgi:glycosyltransferase involved in cell wall biosynthesis